MNIRDKIHPSKQPAGATHYNEDWRCSKTEGIQYFKVGVDGYHYWATSCDHPGWVRAISRMPALAITPLPNLQIEMYAAAIQALEGAAKEFVVTEAKRMLTDPTDELGKVWDVLHAAGINSGGELSASEGVKLLADRLLQTKVLLNSNYGRGRIGRFVPDEPKPMCDHDWGAHRSQQCQQCVKCMAVRSFDE